MNKKRLFALLLTVVLCIAAMPLHVLEVQAIETRAVITNPITGEVSVDLTGLAGEFIFHLVRTGAAPLVFPLTGGTVHSVNASPLAAGEHTFTIMAIGANEPVEQGGTGTLFVAGRYPVTFVANPATGVASSTITADGATISSGQLAAVGDNVVFTVDTAAGYGVVSWSVNGTTVQSTALTHTAAMVTGGLDVIVNLVHTANEHTVAFSVTGGTITTATVDGTDVTFPATVADGAELVIIVAPSAGFQAVAAWAGAPAADVQGNTLTTTVTDDMTITATFAAAGQATPPPTWTPDGPVTTSPPPSNFNIAPYRPRVEAPAPPDAPPTGQVDDNMFPFPRDPIAGNMLFPASHFFGDVDPNAWYYNYVGIVASHGIFTGTGPRVFAPRASMTRAMFTRAVANMERVNLDAVPASGTFGDVDQGAWYASAINWASGQNLVQGVGGGNFAPDVSITREQMAVLLHRYATSRNIALPTVAAATPFNDQAEISDWAVDAISAIQQAGIVRGRDDGGFDPQATATRAEVAGIFARFFPLTQ